MSYTVYKHVCPNNKIYVGITGLNVKKRWSNGYGYRNNQFFFRAVEKYGWDNIKHKILFSNLSKEQAEQKEIELISLYKSDQKEHGYNVSSGGGATTLGAKMSDETKEKIRKACKGRTPWNKGKPRTPEERKKMSKNRAGIVPWNKGKKWSDKTKENISKTQLARQSGRRVVCLETNEIFYSAAEAQRQTGVDRSAISKCCRKQKNFLTAGKKHWVFAENGE